LSDHEAYVRWSRVPKAFSHGCGLADGVFAEYAAPFAPSTPRQYSRLVAGWLVLGVTILVIFWLSEGAARRKRRQKVCPGCREERLRARGRWVLRREGYRLQPLSRRESAQRARLPIPEHTCNLSRKQMAERARFRGRIYGHKRRLWVAAGGSYTRGEWDELQSRFPRCPGCDRAWKDIRPLGQRKSPITIDHIIPLSRGGTNHVSNLQPLCASCNSRKGNRLPNRPRSPASPVAGEPLTAEAVRVGSNLDPATIWYKQRYTELHRYYGSALPEAVLKPLLAEYHRRQVWQPPPTLPPLIPTPLQIASATTRPIPTPPQDVTFEPGTEPFEFPTAGWKKRRRARGPEGMWSGCGYELEELHVAEVERLGGFVMPVAGITYHADSSQRPEFAAGMTLTLVPEPDNPHDPNAVGVWDADRCYCVGYVPSQLAPVIRSRIETGRLSHALCVWEWILDKRRVGIQLLVAPGVPVPRVR
jgi:5-methylcytosine-specific restriction endonuclease McrA